jgi:hypothetical protein
LSDDPMQNHYLPREQEIYAAAERDQRGERPAPAPGQGKGIRVCQALGCTEVLLDEHGLVLPGYLAHYRTAHGWDV